MRKTLIFLVIIIGASSVAVLGDEDYSTNVLTPTETSTESFYKISKIPIELVDKELNPITKEVRISYVSEDLVQVDRSKTVTFRIEVPSWEKPFIINKVWKSQVILGSYLQGLIVDEGKITINQFKQPTVRDGYYYQSYSTFRPFKVTAGEEVCYAWAVGGGFFAAGKSRCANVDIDLAIHEDDENYKAHIGVMLIWEIAFMIPMWDNVSTEYDESQDLYERTITDRYCVAKGTNQVLPADDCGIGVSLDQVQDQFQTYEPTTTTDLPIFVMLPLFVLPGIGYIIARKKLKK
jgi:hypothetical protein